jgi:protein-S-isoprenylcysteine O-methyltransferase Ste14
MFIIVLMALGWSAFLIGTLVFGVWLRQNPRKEAAERSSRMVHSLYYAGLVLPGVVAIFYPGLTHLDGIFGIPSLPFPSAALVLGVIFLLAGIYLTAVSMRALSSLGKGANAFRLTRWLIVGDIYERARNPMSLGYYLVCVGLGLVADSTCITLGALLVVIPTHIFFLKYFEELELELRFGESYAQYKRRVPFLIPKFGGMKRRSRD